MLTISELFGTEEQLYDRFKNDIMFNLHVAVPAVVQSYDAATQTIEAKPTIRERVIGQDGSITFVDYPLLVNVAVAFMQVGNFSIHAPISKGDECIVLFTDMSYDLWWKNGGIQNPVEQRRHDLSDGIAIFGIKNQKRIENARIANDGQLSVMNLKTGTGIKIGENDGSISAVISKSGPGGQTIEELDTVNFSEIIELIHPDGGGT